MAQNTNFIFGDILHLYEAKKWRLDPYLMKISDTCNNLLNCPNDVFHSFCIAVQRDE